MPFGKKKRSEGDPVVETGSALKTPTAGVQPADYGPQQSADTSQGISRDKTQKIKTQVAEVTQVMETNLTAAKARGENLESLQDKVEDLEAGAGQFSKNATKVKKNLWYKNMKMTICVSVLALVIFAIIGVFVYFQIRSKG